jgi:SAM-dependent methyltransferase
MDLGAMPPVNSMGSRSGMNLSMQFYTLNLYMCMNCLLVQIGERLKKETVFPNSYPYLSGMTKSLIDNFKNQAQQCIKKLHLDNSDLVLDVGSNDGSLLKQYAESTKILGIEPTQAADVANSNNILTLKQYFDQDTVIKIIREFGKAKLVTACNVFAHIDDMNELIKNIKAILKPEGVFVSESHYLLELLKTKQFDTIYHEHLRYYSFHFLQKYLESHGFNVFHVEEISSHGGSIRVWAELGTALPVDPSVANQIQKELQYKLNDISTLQSFASEIINWRFKFRELMASLSISGAKIAGIGAPSRASTLINYCGITVQDLIAVAELKGSSKIGTFMPGTAIPVLEEIEVMELEPTHLLLLSWHLKDNIIKSLRASGFKGCFIVPLPEPMVYEN